MSSAEHLEILRQGVSAWNRWRRAEPLVVPVLRDADLAGRHLKGIDFTSALLTQANLTASDLSKARFTSADMRRADLRSCRLTGASFQLAELTGASLRGSDCSGADFTDSALYGADLFRTRLDLACFKEAHMLNTNFGAASLCRANFSGAQIGSTIFANNDFSQALGLEQVTHIAASFMSIDTLYKSHGKIPDAFLRGCGIPEDVIEHLLPLIRSGPPIQWHSCFISYSSRDEEFTRRLHSRMRDAHMRVWFAPEDLKGGRKLHEQLFDAIQIHDRLLLVLSENSMQSEWVMTEIRKARQVELKENRRKLFPIRLCTFDELRNWTCFDTDSGKDLAVEVREYFIPDFSNWKDHDTFEKEFEKLQRDLKADQKPRPAA